MLGLGVSRKLAQVYGGDISFISVPQRGTRFCVTLPGHIFADER